MQRIVLLFLKCLIFFFSVLPLPCLYALSGTLSFILSKVAKYRNHTVHTNLRNAFPEKSQAEIGRLAQQFYCHLSDVLLESIKGLTMHKEVLQQRFVYRNPEIFDPLYAQGQSAILLGSHYGNWEWGVLSFPLAVRHRVVGIFKPLKNRLVDDHLNRLRTQWGLRLASMPQAGRAVIENRTIPTIFVLIADQTPTNTRDAHWINFLHQDTPFLHGPEKLARTTGYPIFSFHIKRQKRGFYEVTFKKLCDQLHTRPPGDLTRMFAEELQAQIVDNPPEWLWSHRRWKRKRPPVQP